LKKGGKVYSEKEKEKGGGEKKARGG